MTPPEHLAFLLCPDSANCRMPAPCFNFVTVAALTNGVSTYFHVGLIGTFLPHRPDSLYTSSHQRWFHTSIEVHLHRVFTATAPFPSQCPAVSGFGTPEEGLRKLSLLTKTSECPLDVLRHKSRQQHFCQGRPRNRRRLNHSCRDIRRGQLLSSQPPPGISSSPHFLSHQSGQEDTLPSRSEPHGRASFNVLTHVAMRLPRVLGNRTSHSSFE